MKKKITVILSVAMLALAMTSTSIMAGAGQGAAGSRAVPNETAGGKREKPEFDDADSAEKGLVAKGRNLTVEDLSAKLDALVAEGKLTREQADEMLARHEEMLANPDSFGRGIGFAGDMPIGKGLTTEELSAKLDALVAEGKLTQEQADEMLARHEEMLANPDAFKMERGFNGGMGGMFKGQNMTIDEFSAKLDALVAEGKLTREQADKMLARHEEMLANPDAFKMEKQTKSV